MSVVKFTNEELIKRLDMASDDENRELIRELSMDPKPVILNKIEFPHLLPVYKVVVPHKIIELLEFFLPFRENFHISANNGKLVKCAISENRQIPKLDRTLCQTFADERMSTLIDSSQLFVNAVAEFMKEVNPSFTPDPKYFGIERYVYAKTPNRSPNNEFVPNVHQDDSTAIQWPTVTMVIYYYRYRHDPKQSRGLIGGNISIYDDNERLVDQITTDSGTGIVFNGNVNHAVDNMNSYSEDKVGVYRDTFVVHIKRCSWEEYQRSDCGQRIKTNPNEDFFTDLKTAW